MIQIISYSTTVLVESDRTSWFN